MPTGVPIRSYSDGSTLYMTNWDDLSQYDIRNWRLNRPHDETRVPDIMKQLKTQEYVDGIIYMCRDRNGLICYDGIHRIESLKTLYQMDSTHTHTMLVHLIPEYDEAKIRDKFDSLNKCIPVPEIYSSAHRELDNKKLVEDIVKYFTSTYPEMFKPTKRPNLPHEIGIVYGPD